MDVAFLCQPGVLASRRYAPRCPDDALLHERQQALARRILDSLHANPADAPPILLSGHCDQCFDFQVSAPPALVESAPVAFVDFALSRPANPVPAAPSRAAFRAATSKPFAYLRPNTLWSQSEGYGLLGHGCQPAHRTKPRRQLMPRVHLRDGHCGQALVAGHPSGRTCSQQTFGYYLDDVHLSFQPPQIQTAEANSSIGSVAAGTDTPWQVSATATRWASNSVTEPKNNLPKLQAYYILGLPESTGYPSQGISAARRFPYGG